MNQLKEGATHAFTIKYEGIVSRIIIPTHISPAYDPAQFVNMPVPFPLVPIDALWDTGATKSVLTHSTVASLGLIPVGKAQIAHAGGTTETSTYAVNIVLPNKVAVVGVLVSECDNVVGNFGAIIGMDIITKGDTAITNLASHTWMTYRLPSALAVDFVEEINKTRYAGVGRNSPCPCGKKDENGKPIKFKYCHGK